MNGETLKRVFIHEIGHFVARELNFELYTIGEGVERIFIERHCHSNFIDYSGEAKAKIPKGYTDKGEIENVNEYIAVILYGCIFQTLYSKSISAYEFKDCFDLNDDTNGKHDAVDFGCTDRYISGDKRKKIVDYIEREYLSELIADKTHLKKLFDLNVIDFLDDEVSGYSVNLELLKEKLSDFLSKHKKYYFDFITNIERIKNE